jgi:hypothetical protein
MPIKAFAKIATPRSFRVIEFDPVGAVAVFGADDPSLAFGIAHFVAAAPDFEAAMLVVTVFVIVVAVMVIVFIMVLLGAGDKRPAFKFALFE